MSLFGESLLTVVRHQRVVPVALAAVTLLAAVNWMLRPDQALRWLGAMLFLPGVLLAATLWYVSVLRSLQRRGVDGASSVFRYFASAVALLFLVIGFRQIVLFGLKIWVEVVDHDADLDMERRILGLASSAVLVIIGNALPKILTPLAMLPKAMTPVATAARVTAGKVRWRKRSGRSPPP